MIRGAVVLAAALLLVSCEAPPAPRPRPPIEVTGTFRDETTVITIELTGEDEYRARVGNVVVPVEYDVSGECQRITFHAPHARFAGCLGAKALVGSLRHANGTEERVYLVRDS